MNTQKITEENNTNKRDKNLLEISNKQKIFYQKTKQQKFEKCKNLEYFGTKIHKNIKSRHV